MQYINIQEKTIGKDIRALFPGFSPEGEAVAVLSPHDDDGIIGAGYAIRAALAGGAKVYVYIFCRGNAGYSDPGEKERIEKTRREETLTAYGRIGVSPENILRFDYSDFSVGAHVGWQADGAFEPVLRAFRHNRITRVLVPNEYREHADHVAVNYIGSYDAPQAGDPILVDWGVPHTVKSVLTYAVWADLSPEDALTAGRPLTLRANRLILAPRAEEEQIAAGIAAYESQGRIIADMIARREERRLADGRYLEAYLAFDPRPKMDFKPYVEFAQSILKG